MGSSARPTQTEGTARRRGRRPASEVSGRSILLETAQRHFSRCGFGGTSLRAIARDADVTPALVCQLFGSKEGLYDALLEKLALDQQTQLAELVRLADLAERYPKAAFERWVQMLVQIGPAISDVPALLMHEVDPMPEEHDNGESRIPRITEKLVRPFNSLHAHTEKGIGSRHYSRYLSRPGLLPPDGGRFCDALGAADIRRIPGSEYGFSRTSCGKPFAAGFEVRFSLTDK